MSTPKKNKLNLINQTNKHFSQSSFQIVLDTVGQFEDLTDSTVNLLLSEDGSIQELNRKFLGKDALTDVISFPSEQKIVPFLGDIIIDIEVAAQQKGNKALLNELQYLFLHGLLHLLGYDHLAAEAAKIMRLKEAKYYSLIKEKS